MVKGWISGHPPDNIFLHTWWVWDGENIFLAYWNKNLEDWKLAEPSFFKFKPENITHYHVLERPDKSHYLKGKFGDGR